VNGERLQQVIRDLVDAPRHRHAMFSEMEPSVGRRQFNPVYIMADSGARGSKHRSSLAVLRG